MASTGEAFGLFWDSENGDRTYSAASFEYWLKKFFTSGVFNGDLQVKATSGMTLEVEAGYTNADGKVKFWNAPFNVTLDAANSTYPRIDTVVIRRDNVNRQITCEKVTGSYSADTPQPTAPTRNSEIFELVIAQIYVGAGVTGITQSNITDTRPNNELCGYITGTVEELDFSAFTAQFEAYFAEFKRNQMADFQAWEVAQQAAYAAWFSLVQQQQIQDKADWDAWYAALQEELHELPEDTAEYLQIEIDEIRTSGTTGSILKITTTETSLEGKTVTVTNGTETRTATFDENLECLISGYKGTGEVTISSSDGIQTASTVVTIPYFGNYQYAIAFWAATVNIQGDDNLKGATITVKDSDDLTVGTVVLNVITGRGVFTAQKADTYTFNFTYQGTDYSESLIVDEQITYSLSLSAGFNWRGWVDTAQYLDSSDYNSLEEVLADELAVRELCLEHACVDYLAGIAAESANVETIINNDLFAKWVNNSDYALDFLGANAVIKALMDEADKYGYGEWVITDDTTTPPTWGAKGNVPVMTANDAPYGTASASSTYSGYSAYQAFDGNPSTFWAAISATNEYLQYDFTNPTCVKKIKLGTSSYSTTQPVNVSLIASNDGFTTSTTLKTWTEDIGVSQEKYIEIENSNYYLSYRLVISATAGQNANIATLQFYGRELSVSVPKMDTNTTPYGEAFYSNGNSSNPAHKAFDGDSASYASFSNQVDEYIGYEFPSAIVATSLYISGDASSGTEFYIEGADSKTGTYTVLGSFQGIEAAKTVNFTNATTYKSYRLRIKTKAETWNRINFYTIQFYGLDYSEKEFEQGATKKWLYDHGVELETFELGNTQGTLVKEVSQMVITATSDNYAFCVTRNVNLSPFNLLRCKIGDIANYGNLAALFYGNTLGSAIAYTSILSTMLPNNVSLDSSSASGTFSYVGVNTDKTTGHRLSVKELWLE